MVYNTVNNGFSSLSSDKHNFKIQITTEGGNEDFKQDVI